MKNCYNIFSFKAMYVFVAFVLFMVGVGVKGVEGQAVITADINWPSWSGENRFSVTDGSTSSGWICDPARCYNGNNGSYTATGFNLGTYSNPCLTIQAEDSYGDGWNSSGIVTLYSNGVFLTTISVAVSSQTITVPTQINTNYGNNSWIGAVYNPASYSNFTNYIGYVTESETFNRVHNSPSGATTNLCSTPTDVFSIRYKMNKTFAAGWYNFTIGGDDGVRLSIDGGSSWLINGWVLQGYTTYSSGNVYLDGNYNLVFEYYENTGGAQSSFSYTYTPPPSNNNCSNAINLTIDAPATSGTLNYASDYNVWYKFTPTCTGSHTVTLSGLSDDKDLYVYSGSCSSLSSIGSSTAGGASNETVTYSFTGGQTYYIEVYDYANTGGNFNIQVASNIPDYSAQIVSINYGSSDWCAGETRTVSVQVQNTGQATWTNSGPDINLGLKWNNNGAYWTDYHVRTNVGGQACGETQTYNLNITAKDATAGPSYSNNLASGSNNLNVNLVYEGCFWFYYGSGTYCGATLASMPNYTSPAINIKPIPTSVSTGSDVTICNGSFANLSGSASGNDVIFEDDFSTNKGWSLGTYWSRGSVTSEPSSDHSPTADNNALACPINSDYGNNWGTYYATSPIINCSNYSTVNLDFHSFSGCENNSWDHMGIQVYNGSTWTTIWSNGTTSFQESTWTPKSYDITAYAAGVSNFQVRFYMGTTDGSVTYSGWAIDDLTISGSNTISYSWTPTTGLSNPNISNPTATPANTTTYTMTASVGGCGVSDDVLVTVLPPFSAGAITGPATSTQCYNYNPTTLTANPSGAAGTYTYQWQSSPNGSAWSDIGGATSSTYDPPALASTTHYRVMVNPTGTPDCAGATASTNTLAYTILPNFSAGAITGPATSTQCYNYNPTTLTANPSGSAGTYTYQWQSSPNGSAWSNIGGATGSTYDPPALTSTTHYRVMVNPTGTPDCAGATASTNTLAYTVLPPFSAGAISGPATSTQCYNYNPTTLTSNPSGAAGTYTYQWQSSPNGSAWSDIGGATSSTYDPPALTSTTHYRVMVNPTGTPDCAGATASTNTIVYTIRPNFTPGAINTTGETICYNGNPDVIGSTTVASGGDGTITYKWQANGVDIASSNSATYDPPAGLTTTTTYTRWAHDGTCNTSWTQSTGSWVVNVRPNFTPGAINTTGETICYNGNPSVIGSTTAASGGDASITYEWRANGTAIPSSNSATYDPPAGFTTTTTYTRWAHDGTCNASWTQSTGSWVVTVRPNFTPGAINTTGETICYNGNPGVIGNTTVASGGDGTITYKWQANGVDIASSNSATYDPPAGLTATTTYTRWAKDNTCNTSWTQSTGSWVVTVNSDFTPGTILSTGETICQGEIPSTIGNSTIASGGDGTITYKWQANGIDIPSSNSASYTPSEGITVNTTYTRWAHDGTCNTSFEQSAGSWVVNVTTAPYPAGLSAGDYFWTGATSNSWNTDENWLYYNGTSYSIASSIPDASSNVFIQSYSGTCATANAVTNASTTVYTQDINIESGLSLGGLSRLEVTGNWNNSGTFIAGTGTVAFVGNTQQTLTTNGETFNNVEINNTSGSDVAILVNSDFRIGGQLTLTSGIVSFSNPIRKVILGNSATTNAGNANSFIDGIVEKLNCSSLVTLPTGNVNTRDIGAGNQTYRIWAPIGLAPSSSTTVNARYLFSNDGLNQWWYHDWTHEAPLTHTSDREYWIVNSSVNTAVTLNWRDNDPCTIHDFCDGATFDNSDLTVAFWSGIWKDAGGAATANYIDGSITSGLIPFGAKGESQITFGSKNGTTPLPVELVSFTGSCSENTAILNWQTASELNNSHFTIEISDDMKYFESIGKVAGAGTTSLTHDYNFTHVTDNNLHYYRLVQTDFDGKTNISQPISVFCSNSNSKPSIYIYPNPFESHIYLVLENFDSETADVEIINQLGQIITTSKIILTHGYAAKEYEFNELKPGVYQVRVISGVTVLSSKIIKK